MSMHEKLVYTNTHGDSVTLTNSVNSNCWIATLTGVDTIANAISSSGGIGQHGVNVTGTKISGRSIAIDGKIFSDKEVTISNVLNAFNPLYSGRLVYEDSLRNVQRYIDCYVESSPDVQDARFPHFQVSLYCPYPMWIDGNGSMKEADVTQNASGYTTTINNYGDVSSGIDASILFTGNCSKPKITNASTNQYIEIDYQFVGGDELHITTGYDNCFATLYRNGQEINIFPYVTLESEWLELERGTNVLNITAYSGINAVNSVDIMYNIALIGARR